MSFVEYPNNFPIFAKQTIKHLYYVRHQQIFRKHN